jgi:CubicO group peptidase (beta-lactamase class C family)
MVNPSTSQRLSQRVADAQSANRLPSLAAGLIRGSELVWSDARGTVDGRGGPRADSNTQYRIGSITKTFVAVAIMQLRDQGLLDVNDPLDRHVGGTTFGNVTIAQLLSHSSGLQSETHGPWWERTEGGDWADLTASEPVLRHLPGRRLHYSNVGFGVLGEVVARYREQSWAEVVEAELLKPLGMSRTTQRPQDPHAVGLAVHPFADVVQPEPEHDGGAMAPAGQLWSTVTDLARWAAFLGGDTGDILSPDTLDEMCEPRAVADVPGAPWTVAFGLGIQVWNLEGKRAVGHGGSMPGFLASIAVSRDNGDGVVAFANSTTGMPGDLVKELMSDLAEGEPLPPSEWSATAVPERVLELTGPWYWGPAAFELRAMAEGWLRLGPADGQGRSSRFRPGSDGEWVGLDGYYAGEPLRVVRDARGSISYLDLASFVFTRTPYDPHADVPGGVDPSGWR